MSRVLAPVPSSRPVARPTRRAAIHRAAFRRAVCLPCQVVRERDFKLVAGLAMDLSPEGMLALAGRRVLTGEQVIVSFRSERLNRWFDAEAVVARVVHGRREGDAGPSIGLAFHDTDPGFRDGVFQSLRFLPPPTPRRSPGSLDPWLPTPIFASVDGRLAVLPS